MIKIVKTKTRPECSTEFKYGKQDWLEDHKRADSIKIIVDNKNEFKAIAMYGAVSEEVYVTECK